MTLSPTMVPVSKSQKPFEKNTQEKIPRVDRKRASVLEAARQQLLEMNDWQRPRHNGQEKMGVLGIHELIYEAREQSLRQW